MNLLKSVVLFTSILFFFASCEKNQVEEEQSQVSAWKKSKEQANHHICLYENNSNGANQADERHTTYPEDHPYYIPVNKVGCSYFNVYIWTGCGEVYTQASLDAIDAYNAIPNTSLSLNLVDNLAAADLFIVCSDLGHGDSGPLGTAKISFDKLRVVFNIARETTFEFCEPPTPLNACHLQFVAMHEIGHALGIFHTDDSNAPRIDGTPENDFYSVFNSGLMPNGFCAGLCEFTEADINAIQILYPTCNGSRSGNSSTPGYQIYPLETFCPNAGQEVTVSVYANDVPNRFRVIKPSGGTAASSGWIGYTNLPGPWGQSLNGPSTAQLNFTATGGQFKLEIETVVQGQTDAWEALISNCGQ